MPPQIVGAAQDEEHLEYLLRTDSMGILLPSSTRGFVFQELSRVLKEDWKYFDIRTVDKFGLGARQPPVLVIDDSAKHNFLAVVRVDNTLYPEYKKLVIFSSDLNAEETLYGNLVSNYLDSMVRKVLSSEKTVQGIYLGNFRATILSSA